VPGPFDTIEHVFDHDVCLDQFRSWSTDRLTAHRDDLVAAQRRLHLQELDVLRVLDERGRIDVSTGANGESAKVVRDKVETARRLEALPAIAEAAHGGRLSDEQLRSVVQLADERTDREWAGRAPNMDPIELARQARCATKPSPSDQRARHEARGLRMWWTPDRAMLHLHGQLPDVMGQAFESTIYALTEQMRPAKGHAWDTLEHRAADALAALCDRDGGDGRDDRTPSLARQPNIQLLVPPSGPAEVAGIPIADSLLEQLRANAMIEPVVIDEQGAPLVVGRRASVLSPKIRRSVLLRDGKCRVPGCGARKGLEVHHLVPRSRGGTDEVANLACVCPAHHWQLVPHGTRALVGNPNLPDGLELVHSSDLPPPDVGPSG
jgi:hypothetical protein